MGAKFNKQKCLKCRYHNYGCGGYLATVRKRRQAVYCNYASITGNTCLKPTGLFTTVDVRGDDYNNCKLFLEGDLIEEVEL